MAPPQHGAPLTVGGRLAVMALALGASSCSRVEPPAPPTPLPARTEWRVECRPVRDERHQACYGPGWDAQRAREPGRFHFYQVSVERKQPSEASLVLFVKRLDIAAVDAKLLAQNPAAEVARYDAASRTVRFDVGGDPVAFVLDAGK